MSTFTGRLDQLEARLQIFIEDKLARLAPIRGPHSNLGRRLVSAMRAGTISTGDGLLLAPDQFIVLAHPSQADMLGDDPALLKDLGSLIQDVGAQAGLRFAKVPTVQISPNEDVAVNQLDIIARISERALVETGQLMARTPANGPEIPPNAFLIIAGIDIFLLKKTVLNIGRHPENDLVLDDPRISRQHAQIRARHGRYEIFDLESTGGTFVNRKRVSQYALHAGDVITLAGVPLIYGQDSDEPLGETQDYVPGADKPSQGGTQQLRPGGPTKFDG